MDIEYIRMVFEEQKRRAFWTKTKQLFAPRAKQCHLGGLPELLQPGQLASSGLHLAVPECYRRLRLLRSCCCPQNRSGESNWHRRLQALQTLHQAADPHKLQLKLAPKVAGRLDISDYTIIDNNTYPPGVGMQSIGSNVSIASNAVKVPAKSPVVSADYKILLSFLPHLRKISNENLLKIRTGIGRVVWDLN